MKHAHIQFFFEKSIIKNQYIDFRKDNKMSSAFIFLPIEQAIIKRYDYHHYSLLKDVKKYIVFPINSLNFCELTNERTEAQTRAFDTTLHQDKLTPLRSIRSLRE